MPAYRQEALYSDVAQVQHENPDLFGSGRLIGRNLILTARHVVTGEGASEPTTDGWSVRLFGAKPKGDVDWQWHEAKVVWVGKEQLDLALLLVWPKAGTPEMRPHLRLRIAKFNRVKNQQVCGLGFPLGARIDGKRQLMAPSGGLKDEAGPILSWGIDQSDLPQEPDDDWPGLSGASVLLTESNDEHVIWVYGVVQYVPAKFNRQLAVARLETALADTDFCQTLIAAEVAPEPAVDPIELDTQAALSKAPQGLVRLLQEVMNELNQMEVSDREFRELYLATISDLDNNPRRHDVQRLEQMIDELGQISGADQDHLYEFMARIARLAQINKTQADRIEAFIRNSGGNRTYATIESKLRETERFRLQVSIDPNFETGQPSWSVKAVLFSMGPPRIPRKKWHEPCVSIGTVDRNAPEVAARTTVRRAVEKVVMGARRTLSEQYELDETHLEVEFLLPWPFFLEDLDNVVILKDPPDATVGRQHVVYLRWRERLLEPHETNVQTWHQLGKSLAATREQPAAPIWLGHQQCMGINPYTDCKGLHALSFSPTRERGFEHLRAIIASGFPFVAWPRREPGNWETFEIGFENWAKGYKLDDLPRGLCELRQKGPKDLADIIALFWDDPEQAYAWRYEDVSTELAHG